MTNKSFLFILISAFLILLDIDSQALPQDKRNIDDFISKGYKIVKEKYLDTNRDGKKEHIVALQNGPHGIFGVVDRRKFFILDEWNENVRDCKIEAYVQEILAPHERNSFFDYTESSEYKPPFEKEKRAVFKTIFSHGRCGYKCLIWEWDGKIYKPSYENIIAP